MKERPIIFNAEMVRAILDGRKTQTRRIMKVQPDEDGITKVTNGPWVDTSERAYNCPFGSVGDRLYVREAFSILRSFNFFDSKVPYYVPDFWYWADGNPEWGDWTRPKSGVAMPKEASRITLEITGVRVERLQDISQEDAQAEGMELTGWRPTYSDPDSGGDVQTPYDNFAELWQSIYGAESWSANPFVWVVEFKRV